MTDEDLRGVGLYRANFDEWLRPIAYKQQQNEEKVWVVLFHSSTCPACIKTRPVWNALVDGARDAKRVSLSRDVFPLQKEKRFAGTASSPFGSIQAVGDIVFAHCSIEEVRESVRRIMHEQKAKRDASSSSSSRLSPPYSRRVEPTTTSTPEFAFDNVPEFTGLPCIIAYRMTGSSVTSDTYTGSPLEIRELAAFVMRADPRSKPFRSPPPPLPPLPPPLSPTKLTNGHRDVYSSPRVTVVSSSSSLQPAADIAVRSLRELKQSYDAVLPLLMRRTRERVAALRLENVNVFRKRTSTMLRSSVASMGGEDTGDGSLAEMLPAAVLDGVSVVAKLSSPFSSPGLAEKEMLSLTELASKFPQTWFAILIGDDQERRASGPAPGYPKDLTLANAHPDGPPHGMTAAVYAIDLRQVDARQQQQPYAFGSAAKSLPTPTWCYDISTLYATVQRQLSLVCTSDGTESPFCAMTTTTTTTAIPVGTATLS